MRMMLTETHRRHGRIRTTALHTALQRNSYCRALGLAARLLRKRDKTKYIFHYIMRKRRVLTHVLCTAFTLPTANLEHLTIAANVQDQCQESS